MERVAVDFEAVHFGLADFDVGTIKTDVAAPPMFASKRRWHLSERPAWA
jgi:hypothetical protein